MIFLHVCIYTQRTSVSSLTQKDGCARRSATWPTTWSSCSLPWPATGWCGRPCSIRMSRSRGPGLCATSGSTPTGWSTESSLLRRLTVSVGPLDWLWVWMRQGCYVCVFYVQSVDAFVHGMLRCLSRWGVGGKFFYLQSVSVTTHDVLTSVFRSACEDETSFFVSRMCVIIHDVLMWLCQHVKRLRQAFLLCS